MTKTIELIKDITIRDDMTAKQIYDYLEQSRCFDLKCNYGIPTEFGLTLPYISVMTHNGNWYKLYFENVGESAKLRKVEVNMNNDSMIQNNWVVVYRRHWWN